jgi:lipoprotein NlpI
MIRLWSGCLLALALSATAAAASGYDDLASGLSAAGRGDNDRAITYFTSALAARDLNESLVSTAYVARGRALLNKEECRLAVADFSAAIKSQADNFEGYLFRGVANHCTGEDKDAIADFTQAAALKPSADVYWGRGQARWGSGDFDGAIQDFAIAEPLRPKWPYPALWLAMTKLRTGKFNTRAFADTADNFDRTEWPGPIFELFRGNATPDVVFQAAGEGSAEKIKGDLCEADFYVAEWWIAQNGRAAAKPLLARAYSNCPHNFAEYTGAGLELKRLQGTNQ